MIPHAHKIFIAHTLPRLEEDSRILGVAAAGSWITRELDEYSDLDLVLVVDPAQYQSVLQDMSSIALGLGTCIASFTGDHVGVKNLLICLFEDPLLHVDLKFISLDDFSSRIENPEVLWERNGELTKAIEENKPNIPHVDLQWIENRFWTWIHYAAARLGRGEIFETIHTLSFLRAEVLAPMASAKAHKVPRGLRRIEQYCPEEAEAMKATLAGHDAQSCEQALRAAAKIYVDLRETLDRDNSLQRNRRAEMAAMKYLHQAGGNSK